VHIPRGLHSTESRGLFAYWEPRRSLWRRSRAAPRPSHNWNWRKSRAQKPSRSNSTRPPSALLRRIFSLLCARTAHIEASNGNENERRFQIVVRKEPGGFSGQLSIVERAEEGAPRTVHARTCAEVFDVLSLIAAVAVDPAAARVSLPPAASEPEVQAVLETPVASTPLEPTLAPPTTTEKNTAIEPSPTASPRTAFALGGNLGAASSPNILASGTLFAESKRR